MSWLDSFPHGFQGWGPQAPDPEGGRRLSTRRPPDQSPPTHASVAQYFGWGPEQMRKLDEDYDAWRKEFSSTFADDFAEWRSKRRQARQDENARSAHPKIPDA